MMSLTHKQMSGRIRQAGISLLEVSLSVGIIAVIIVLATMMYSSTRDHEQINMLNTNMGALSDAETRYSLNNGGDFVDDNSASSKSAATDLVNKGYLSASLANCATGSSSGTYTNCVVTNPWGGPITVALGSGNTSVTFTGKANALTTCNQINEQNKVDMKCNTATLAVVKTIGAD